MMRVRSFLSLSFRFMLVWRSFWVELCVYGAEEWSGR